MKLTEIVNRRRLRASRALAGAAIVTACVALPASTSHAADYDGNNITPSGAVMVTGLQCRLNDWGPDGYLSLQNGNEYSNHPEYYSYQVTLYGVWRWAWTTPRPVPNVAYARLLLGVLEGRGLWRVDVALYDWTGYGWSRDLDYVRAFNAYGYSNGAYCRI